MAARFNNPEPLRSDGSGEKVSLLKAYGKDQSGEKRESLGWESYDQAESSAEGSRLEERLGQHLLSRLYEKYDTSSGTFTASPSEGWETPLQLYTELDQLREARGSPSSHPTASAPENASDVHTRALGYLNSDTADAKRYEHIWASLPEAIKTASIARPVDDVTSPNHKGPRPRWRSIRSVFSDSSKSGLEKGTGPIRSQSEIADPNAYRLVSKHAEATLREMRTLMRGIYSGKYLVNDGFRDNYNPTAKAGEKDWTRATTDVWEKGQQLSNEPLSLSRAFRQQEWVAEAEQCLQIDKAREAYKIGKDLPKEVNMAGWLDVLQGSTAQSSRRPGENQYGPITR